MDSSQDEVAPEAGTQLQDPGDGSADFAWIVGLMGLVFFPIAWLGVGAVNAAVVTLLLLGFLWVLLRGR